MGRKTGRNSHITFSLSQENAEFVREFGGAKATGDGRYNFSELIDEYITDMRGGGSLEQQATFMQAQREALLAQLQDIEVTAKSNFGTTLDDFLASVRANGKVDAAKAKTRAQERAATRVEYLAELTRNAGDRTRVQLREWLTGPGWKDELQEHGLTVRDAIKHITEARK